MVEWVKKWLKLELTRDNNYYFGLTLLHLGIISLVVYLLLDAYEPLAFLITFLISGWGFILLWKSDNDLRFKMARERIEELEKHLAHSRLFVVPAHLRKKSRGSF
ncbi:MAG: hypothetical protein ACM3X9_01075 [Bacillota bacterium]